MSEKITLDTFRAWLQGVEEMQEDGWTPSESQWKKIREKIDMIENNTVVQTQPTRVEPTYSPRISQNDSEHALHGAANHHDDLFIPTESSMQVRPRVEPTPLPPTVAQLTASFDPGAPAVKTPNIDSSNGYVSPFTV